MRIVIPGGSGQIGQLLARHFTRHGHHVTVLSRYPHTAAWDVVAWDGLTAGDWVESLEGSDVCINLTGRSVNCRYTADNRRAILNSRVDSTRILNQVISTLRNPPRVWLNASTATIYRHEFDRDMDEATGIIGGSERGAPDTWKFSIAVAKAWEEEFFSIPTPRTRKVALRSAITMSPDAGGAFEVLLNLVRFGLGGSMGSGQQFVSWIHEGDFVRILDLLIADDRWHGVVNLAAPNPLPNQEFMYALRSAWGAEIGLPSPAWMIEIGTWLLRTESELVLKSRRVVPGRLLESGFVFEHPDWPTAAFDLCNRWRREHT